MAQRYVGIHVCSLLFANLWVQIMRWRLTNCGYVEEIPGVNTQGKTLKEARENLREAVLLILESNRELAERDLIDKKAVKEQLEITTK